MNVAGLVTVGAVCVALVCAVRLIMVTRRTRKGTGLLIEALSNGDTTYMPRISDRTVSENLEAIRKMLESLRAESAKRDVFLKTMVERSATGIVVFRCSDGRAVLSNGAAVRLLGRTVVTSVKQFAETRLGRLLEQKETITGSEVMKLGDGIAVVSVSELESGGETYVMLTLDDATSAVADRDMDSWMRFSQVVVHELNNALMPIMSLAGNVLESPEGTSLSDSVRQQLRAIVSASEYLRNFVNSYRHLAHLPDPMPRPFLLRDFLERCVNLAYCMTDCKSEPMPEITIDMSGNDEVMVYSDEGMLSQSIVNLLKNAVENTRLLSGKGAVTIKGELQADEAVTIEISDNGPEIAEEISDKIFIPFFTTKPGGSGIGLALSRQLLRRNGGASVELAKRTPHPTFRIVIP
ncbi:MAG: HAMP domain-containing histidine kinase [Muribaculaceae bacterium]|nr:HAMP domain-containing histidine kinase [Muribaculaceae bacterium]